MLVFVIPLQSKAVSNSWKKISQLFEKCIQSVCQQTSPQLNLKAHNFSDYR